MSDHDLATNHIDQLEKRLVSLHDLGIDTAALRSQLAFARTQVHEGRVAEALSICEDVANTARRLADGSEPQPERPRTGRFTRDQLAEAVKDLLSQGLLAKLMAEQRSGPDVRLEARLNDLDERLRGYIGHEADALRVEQQLLREELDQVRRSLGTAVATPSIEPPAAGEAANPGKEPLWAARLHSILVKAIRRADAQAAQIAGIVQQIATQGAANAGTAGLTARVEALRSSIADDLRTTVERIPAAIPVSEALEPAWSQQLASTMQVVAERLQAQPPATPAESGEPAWSQQLASTMQVVAERLQEPVSAAASPAAALEVSEPAWAQALRDTLDAMATRLSAQPLTLVAEPAAATEPAWAQALRDALANAEARHQELLAALAARPAGTVEMGVGEQLAGAFERGLQQLGEVLSHHAPMGAPQPMDDSRSALSPVTAPMPDHVTTKAVAHTTTRADRTAVAESVDPDLVKRMVEREVEAHLGARNTSAIGKPPASTESIRALVAAELDVRQGGAIERNDRSDVGDLRATLLRLLPDLLADEQVRQKLFAVLALEAVSKPGALGELTGLRTFLKRELKTMAEDLSTKLQPA